MRKFGVVFLIAAAALGMVGCTGGANQEQIKEEVTKYEGSTAKLDSSMSEVQKTSQELDDVLSQLEAQ